LFIKDGERKWEEMRLRIRSNLNKAEFLLLFGLVFFYSVLGNTQLYNSECKEIIKSVEKEYLDLLKEVNEKNKHISKSIMLALRYIRFMKKVCIGEIEIKTPEGGKVIFTTKFYEEWANQMRGLGVKCIQIREIIWFSPNPPFVRKEDKIKQDISDLYFDEKGYLIIPGISFLKQQLQKMNFK